MRIAITGGTGFVGKALTEHLLNQNHHVIILTRNAKKQHSFHHNLTYVEWLNDGNEPELALEGIDAIVHLAGKSINARWTKKNKEKIFDSRIKSTDALINILANLQQKPQVVISASAIGIYGTSISKTFTEETTNYGDDFLANMAISWEIMASEVKNLGIRFVTTRFGVILGQEGALPKMTLPYEWFIGGTIGTGKQWVSWIHIQDAIKIIEFILTHPEIEGPINVTAPKPVTMKDFGITIGKVLNRPHWLPVPSFALELLLGEMSMLVLKGQKVLPSRLKKLGYTFSYPELEKALRDILKK